MSDKSKDNADWRHATWEGAERESLRRWAALPLESIIAALEEMQALNEALHGSPIHAEKAQIASRIQQQHGDYKHGGDDETSGK